MKLNDLYKMRSPLKTLQRARHFFGGDVTLSNEKINRIWSEKPIDELKKDIQAVLHNRRNHSKTAMEVLRDIFTEVR